MAHEIDLSTGKAAVFVTGQPPWHGLGAVVKNAVTSREALQLAHLDWTVEQWPLQAVQGAQSSDVPRHKANVRSDTHAVLGVVSERYRVFQNHQAFDFMDGLIGEQLAMYETAGSLQGGRRVWMLARIPGEFRAGADDVIDPYVLLVNTHDGTGALRLLPTTVRVVCQNTLNLALRGRAAVGESIPHYESLRARVAAARQTLGIVTRRMEMFGEELQALTRQSVNSAWIRRYFYGLMTPPKDEFGQARLERLFDRWHENFESPRQSLPGIRHTAWSAFNAVSEWADHQRTFRGLDTRARAERRLNSIWFGQSDQIKQRAYSQALAAANN